MHIALNACRPPHTNEPVQFWIGFGLVLIGGSGLNHLGRDCVLGRPCTPIHCLCDAFLGYTNSCYKVGLQSLIIANILD